MINSNKVIEMVLDYSIGSPAIINNIQCFSEINRNSNQSYYDSSEDHNQKKQNIESCIIAFDLNCSVAEFINGDFINEYNLKKWGVDPKSYIGNIVKVVLESFPDESHHITDIRTLSLYVTTQSTQDIQSFWKMMIEYEIQYLKFKINDLGYWEWSNFGIGAYNSLANCGENKFDIFSRINSILSYIMNPNNLNFSIEEVNNCNKIFTLKTNYLLSNSIIYSMDLRYDKFKNFQNLLDFIYNHFLVKTFPQYSYEIKWILESNGIYLKKNEASDARKLEQLGIYPNSTITLKIINHP